MTRFRITAAAVLLASFAFASAVALSASDPGEEAHSRDDSAAAQREEERVRAINESRIRISVRVVEESRQPAADALLDVFTPAGESLVGDLAAKTDEHGFVSLRLAPGKYKLTARLGDAVGETDVEVTSGRRHDVLITVRNEPKQAP